MKVFCSMCLLRDITFHKILPLDTSFLQPPCFFLLLKGVRILYVSFTITVQHLYTYRRFKIQPCNGAVLCFNYFYYLIASPKLFPFATFLLFLFFYKWNFLYKWKKLKTSQETCFLCNVFRDDINLKTQNKQQIWGTYWEEKLDF